MSKSTIGNVIRALMFKKGINTSELARAVDLPQQTLQRLVAGACSNPHAKTLKPLAEFFEVSLEQLKGEEALPPALVELDLPANPNKPQSVPVIPLGELDAYFANTEEHTPASVVHVDDAPQGNLYATKLEDASMEPYFSENGTLILNPEFEVKDRMFALVKIAEANLYLFRQIMIDGDQMYLKSINLDLSKFPMRIMHKEDVIVGSLVEFRHRYSN